MSENDDTYREPKGEERPVIYLPIVFNAYWINNIFCKNDSNDVVFITSKC